MPEMQTAAELIRIAQGPNHQLLVHPLIRVDLSRDQNLIRKDLNSIIFRNYPYIQDYPVVSERIRNIVGTSDPESNDWVDDHLIAAVNEGAADVLITEDQKLIRKARRSGLIGERAMTMAGVLKTLRRLADVSPRPNPSVKKTTADKLDAKDPIFQSIRSDYPTFDEWFSKVRSERRIAWIIEEFHHLAAIAIINQEIPTDVEYELEGWMIKISPFKVSEESRGSRFGELLLKDILEYALENQYDYVYFTTRPSNEAMMSFGEQFGFQHTRGHGDEVGMVKPLVHGRPGDASLTNIEFNIRYGPQQYRTEGSNGFIVPIKLQYFNKLFPDVVKQGRLLPDVRPYANAIRKAYICNAGARNLRPGDLLYFYRSQRHQGVMTVGVIEDTFVSSDPNSVAGFVGRRTVYSLSEIAEICASEALAILFRQARLFSDPIPFRALRSEGVLKGPPQSIQSVSQEGIAWLERRSRLS